MTSEELIRLVEDAYEGTYPVFHPTFMACDIIWDACGLADAFSATLPDLNDMGDDELDDLPRRFAYFVLDNTAPSPSRAYELDNDCLFPWRTAPGCAFEVPYAIKRADGSFLVFEDMYDWLTFLDEHVSEAGGCYRFVDFVSKLGVRLLIDF